MSESDIEIGGCSTAPAANFDVAPKDDGGRRRGRRGPYKLPSAGNLLVFLVVDHALANNDVHWDLWARQMGDDPIVPDLGVMLLAVGVLTYAMRRASEPCQCHVGKRAAAVRYAPSEPCQRPKRQAPKKASELSGRLNCATSLACRFVAASLAFHSRLAAL